MVIRFVRNKPTVAGLNESRVSVSELMCDNLNGVAVTQGLNSVGVSPIVESGSGEVEHLPRLQMHLERRVLADGKERGVLSEAPGVIREDFPRPCFSWPHGSISPGSFAAFGVDGLPLEIHVSPHQTLDDLRILTKDDGKMLCPAHHRFLEKQKPHKQHRSGF